MRWHKACADFSVRAASWAARCASARAVEWFHSLLWSSSAGPASKTVAMAAAPAMARVMLRMRWVVNFGLL